MIKHISVEALWKEASNFSTQEIQMNNLKHILKENVWDEEFSFENFIKHLKRCNNANLDFPPILVFDKGEYFVLDGMHRIANAFSKKEKKIDAIVLPESYNGIVILS